MGSKSTRLAVVVLALLVAMVFGRSADEWKSRTIYQLLTDRFARGDGSSDGCGNLGYYCGGNYRGIINNLDYIQGMGFDAIWISPIIDNYNGGYHGYWGRNIYSLNGNFGSEQDFYDFVNACHARDIWVMVDVVGNHMGNTDTNYGSNYLLNDASHYHDYCIISDNDFATYNQNRIENCRLAGLADLKQENDYVRTTLLTWINTIVKKYNIDGLRVDTVPEVPKWFWQQFTGSSGVYTVGEVFNGDMGYVGGYVGTVTSVLNYPFFYWVRDTLFNTKDMTNLRSYYSEWSKKIDLKQLNYMANFVDNHDNARWLSWGGDWEKKKKVFKTGNLLALTSVGIPIVYYGSEQYFAGGNDPNNREILWRNLDRYIFVLS
jgi:alpha-amylase